MVTIDCPWCAEPASLDLLDLDGLTCAACGVQADLAPDPIREALTLAA